MKTLYLDYVAWLPLEESGNVLVSPDRVAVWRVELSSQWGRVATLSAAPGDVQNNGGILGRTHQSALYGFGEPHLVSPVFSGPGSLKIAPHGWRAEKAILVGGPFGAIEGSRIIWNAARAGRQVVAAVVCEAALSLAEAGEISRDEGVAGLTPLLFDAQPAAAEWAAEAIALLADPHEATTAMLTALSRDPHAGIRQRAARALRDNDITVKECIERSIRQAIEKPISPDRLRGDIYWAARERILESL